jgi:hypothetical protein
MQFSATSYCFIHLCSKYSSQRRLLKYSICLMPETKFHTHKSLQVKLYLCMV